MTWLVRFVFGSDGIHELRHAFSAGAGSVFAGCVRWPGRGMSLPVPGSSDGAALGFLLCVWMVTLGQDVTCEKMLRRAYA